jgi:hypothetical protein
MGQILTMKFGLIALLIYSSAGAQVSIAPKKELYVDCESKLPDIASLYSGRSAQRFDKWGSRIVTPVEVYRAIGPLDRKVDSPIWLRTFYPSFKGNSDQSVPQNERNANAIFISAFPILSSDALPTPQDLAKTKEYYANTDTTKRLSLPWLLEEMIVAPSITRGAFYQPIGRREMIQGVPAIYCNSTTISNEHGTCVSRMIVKPDIYVFFQYSQWLLPCWAQIEEGVRMVVELNLNVNRRLPAR